MIGLILERKSLLEAGAWKAAFCLLALMALNAAGGCVSMGTYHSAWTLEPGTMEISVQPQLATRLDESLPTATPTVDLAVRTGIGDRSEFGIRIGPSGFHLGIQLEVFERPKAALSIAPSIGGVRYPVTEDDGLHALEYRFPIVFGVRSKRGTEYTFAPQGILASVGWYHPERYDAFIGAFSAGIRHRLFPGLIVHPEVTVGYAIPIGYMMGIDAPSFDTSRWMFGAGMGFSFVAP